MVVEVANYMSGPFAGQVLADMGADVLKVEPPRGDPYRRFGPVDDQGGVMFRTVNRGKACTALDLKSDEGVAELHRFLDTADVLLTNWRPRVAPALGLDDESVKLRWPQLVWIRVSGYGQDGPSADDPAFDSVIQALSGLALTIDPSEPTLLPMYLVDKVTAYTVAQAALAGLVQRIGTQRGTIVDVSMLDSISYFNFPDVYAGYQSGAAEPDGRVERHLRANRPLPTSDGAIVISPVSGKQLKAALVAAGLPENVEVIRAIVDPTDMASAFYEQVAGALRSGSTEHWLKKMAEADVPAAPVLTVGEHLTDPQAVHNQIYAEPDGSRHMREPRYPALFDGRATKARRVVQ
jgi:crotonobetainyl-CoA:carnitine CoA-transferase CaiB-like acyl-CoA transferase